MSLTCGIIGLPNAGKSTLFNALTKACVAAEPYPFCTIEANTGVVAVPDPRLSQVASVAGCSQTTPAYIKFVDIAGLVKGASHGEGLGNRFLAKIREADLLVHVLRVFEASGVSHVYGTVDPLRDLELVELELVMADISTVETRMAKLGRKQKSGDKIACQELKFLERLFRHLEQAQPARTFTRDKDEEKFLQDLQLLSNKALLYVLNENEGQDLQEEQIAGVLEKATREGIAVLKISAALEAEVHEFSEAERADFLKEYGYQQSGLERLIQTCYRQLGLLTFFTVKGKEARAWTLKEGATALEAAGKVHTDMQRGFIAAETINWQALLEEGSVPRARSNGKLRLEGKGYIIQDGDVLFFRFYV
ncbi:MAG: redox-regulated ATPase YchF [Dethiobacteria bacterium]|jgi:GTP-binding protein YchF